MIKNIVNTELIRGKNRITVLEKEKNSMKIEIQKSKDEILLLKSYLNQTGVNEGIKMFFRSVHVSEFEGKNGNKMSHKVVSFLFLPSTPIMSVAIIINSHQSFLPSFFYWQNTVLRTVLRKIGKMDVRMKKMSVRMVMSVLSISSFATAYVVTSKSAGKKLRGSFVLKKRKNFSQEGIKSRQKRFLIPFNEHS